MTALKSIISLMPWAALVAVIAVVAALILGPFMYAGWSAYLIWHRGYGPACDTRILSEALSPSKQWLARARFISCRGPGGDQSVDVVLVPNVAVPLAIRYTDVFSRTLGSGMRDQGDHLVVRWLDDHSLELDGAPCVPCQNKRYPERLCDWECRATDEVMGITVSLKLSQN